MHILQKPGSSLTPLPGSLAQAVSVFETRMISTITDSPPPNIRA